MVDTAKITSKGQVTLPVDVRKKLGVGEGDKIAFYEINGDIMVVNADDLVFRRAQASLATELELDYDDETVVNIMSERRKLAKQRAAALERAREAFAGEAERLGLKNEDDVVALVKEVRQELWDEANASCP